MEELKQSLQNELSHVKTVWFDANDNWYIHKVSTAVKSLSRDEILGSSEPETSTEVETGKKNKKK